MYGGTQPIECLQQPYVSCVMGGSSTLYVSVHCCTLADDISLLWRAARCTLLASASRLIPTQSAICPVLPQNVHSIMNTGLLNFSGTRMQRTGAIFGSGIYTRCVWH